MKFFIQDDWAVMAKETREGNYLVQYKNLELFIDREGNILSGFERDSRYSDHWNGLLSEEQPETTYFPREISDGDIERLFYMHPNKFPHSYQSDWYEEEENKNVVEARHPLSGDSVIFPVGTGVGTWDWK